MGGGWPRCLFVRPRPNSQIAYVAAFAATDPAGLRLLQRLPVFLPGAAWPDCTLLSSQMLKEGLKGVLAARFLGTIGASRIKIGIDWVFVLLTLSEKKQRNLSFKRFSERWAL